MWALNLARTFSPVASVDSSPLVASHHEAVARRVASLRSSPLPPLPAHPSDADFTRAALFGELASLDIRKAYGPDGIHPFFVQAASDEFLDLLLPCFNFFWSRGVIPQIWKTANVSVLYKGSGSKETADSYRPL